MKLSEAQINQIPALIEAKKNQKEIAMQFGCSRRTIQFWMKRWRDAGKVFSVKRGRPPIRLVLR